MELIKAIVLGFVQGLTEFLPVSSSGHLAIFKNILGMKDMGITFDILLHIGTFIAVCVVYWRDVLRLTVDVFGILTDAFINAYGFIRMKIFRETPHYRRIIRTAYRKFALLVIVSTIPTGIIGILGKDLIESASNTLLIPGFCLMVTGTLLLISDNLPDGKKTPKHTTYRNAIFVGICQGMATLPGISRSGTTITAELFCGFRRDFAVKYSFIMSIPAILGAAVLDLKDIGNDALSGKGIFSCVVGMIVAAVAGYLCIKTMLVIVKNKNFKYFAYYCYGVGAIAIIGHIVQSIMA